MGCSINFHVNNHVNVLKTEGDVLRGLSGLMDSSTVIYLPIFLTFFECDFDVHCVGSGS